MTEPFAFTGLTGRRPGAVVRAAALVLPGVRAVQAQVEPYAAAWRAHNAAALAATRRTGQPLWVALGDSMTQGIGASAPDRGWVGQLAGRLGRYRVVNLSQSGARVRDVLDSQLPAMAGLGVAPALVTLLVGSNDLFRRAGREALVADHARLLAAVPAGTVVANLPQDQGVAAELNAAVYRAVARRGLVLADTHRPRTTSWRGKLAADRFHPNDRGYADIAAVFLEAITGSPAARPG